MSYESEMYKRIENSEDLPEKLNISILKYFWQSNPLTGKKITTIPKFLRKIGVLKNFSDNELRVLSKYLHLRTFKPKEIIFKQNEVGVGFYFIYSGYVDICLSDDNHQEVEGSLITLERFDYFGELALLQEKSFRNASAVSRDGCELLGIFKPDIDSLINEAPVVAAKLLQSVSLIISNRLFSVTKELKELNYKLSTLEGNKN
ncbi:MAG: cyclic nucleotide-binding domain-containing protein [Oligoflexia bacterium]|nr:cyclic nucleotide-binding domain-containing protein [Oligoflexia bacterium]